MSCIRGKAHGTNVVNTLRRYWFTFDVSNENRSYTGYLPAYGCGITAYDYADALNILRHSLFPDALLPVFRTVTEDIDVATLDANHVLPNAGVPVWRGVWFPALNMWYGPFTGR